MVSNVSSSSSAFISRMFTSQLSQKMVSGDTDGTQGLSKNELAKLTASDTDEMGSNFLKALSNNFDSIDSDGNGEITTDELGSLIKNSSSTGTNATSSTATNGNVEDALVSAIKQDLSDYKIDSTKTPNQSASATAGTCSSLEDNSGSVPASTGGASMMTSKMDLNKDGVVSQEEVSEYLQQQEDAKNTNKATDSQSHSQSATSSGTDNNSNSGESSSSAIDGATIASRIFAQMDTNKDGVVSEAELKAYEAKQKEANESKVQAMTSAATSSTTSALDSANSTDSNDTFKKIDADGNGKISGNEFETYLKTKDSNSTTATNNSSSGSYSSNDTTDMLKSAAKNFANISESFVEKMIDKYANNITSFASTLGIAS